MIGSTGLIVIGALRPAANLNLFSSREPGNPFARAGEQGRGVAVVADEVCQLAERTSEARRRHVRP